MKIKKRERNLKLDLEARKLTRNGTTVKNKNISEHTHTHIPTKTLNTLEYVANLLREKKKKKKLYSSEVEDRSKSLSSTRWRRIVNRGEGGKNKERIPSFRERTMADKFMGGRSREGWPTLSRFYERERESSSASSAQLDPE